MIIEIDTNGVDVGLYETTFNGGSGPAQVWMDERYMTDSQYAAFNAGAFSTTGRSRSGTLFYEASVNGVPRIWTFRTTPVQQGTTAGVLDLSAAQKPYGLRKVVVIYTTVNY